MEVPLGSARVAAFSDGESFVEIGENIRGVNCFVVQPSCPPVNQNLMELLVMIDALKRASAKRITAVIPFFGYARQDKKGQPREPISAKMMGDLFVAAGADRIASVDLHTGQIQGFIDSPFDSLTAMPLFEEYLRRKLDGPITFVSPDSGGVKRATAFATHVDAEVAFVYKRRRSDVRNEIAAEWVVGEVKGRHCVIVDDMIDTAGTVIASADLLVERGALSVIVLATHGVLAGPAVKRLRTAPFDEIIITNTLPVRKKAMALPNLTVLSIAPLVAGTIEAIFTDRSVSELFKGENT